MNILNLTSIKKELTVEASQATAFKVFTQKMDLWWPRTHHIGSTPMTEMVLEPNLNGRWYSRHEDGAEAEVGYVSTWQPNDLLVLVWQINGDFKFDPALVTEVEVHFIADGPKTTIIKFEHKNLDRLVGAKAIESMDQGWGHIMDLYKQIAEQ